MPIPALPSRAARWVFLAAVVATFLAVTMGSVVCATDSSAACPNWPGCYVGGVLPKGHVNPVIEFVHRVAAVSTAPLILAAGILGLRHGKGAAVRVLPWVALACALAAGVFGMMLILFTLPLPLGVLDLVCSLLALVLMTWATAVAWRGAPGGTSLAVRTGSAVIAGLLVLHALGVIAAGKGSFTRCMGWPVLVRVPEDSGSLQIVRWVLAAVLACGLVALGVVARREGRVPAWLAGVPFGLLALEVVLGLTTLERSDLTTKSIYSVVAVLVLAATSLVTAVAASGPKHAARTASAPEA